jgi:hypothetical protein
MALKISYLIFICAIGLRVAAVSTPPQPDLLKRLILDVPGYDPASPREPRGVFWVDDEHFVVYITQHSEPKLTGRDVGAPASTNLVFQNYSTRGALNSTHIVPMHGHTEVAISPSRTVVVLTGNALTIYDRELAVIKSFTFPRDDDPYSEWTLKLSPTGNTIWLAKTGIHDQLLALRTKDLEQKASLDFKNLGTWTASDDSIVRLTAFTFQNIDAYSGRIRNLVTNVPCPGIPTFVSNETLLFQTCEGIAFANSHGGLISSFKVQDKWQSPGVVSNIPVALLYLNHTHDFFDLGRKIKAMRLLVFSGDYKRQTHDLIIKTELRYPVAAVSPKANYVATLSGSVIEIRELRP